jgi:ATP-binding protein involved in chromosome partitioning
MSSPTIDAINSALDQVIDPELRRPLPELGMIEDVAISGNSVTIKVLLTVSGCPMRAELTSAVQSAVSAVAGVGSVHVELGVMNDDQRGRVRQLLRGGAEREISFAKPDSLTRVYGIASGKGGVGKSSVTANLAIALAQQGKSVGVVDADIYGHSIPRLLGIIGRRPTAIDQTFIPVEAHGVKVVSLEMFKPQRDEPVAYRGPLLHRVLEQMLADAYWGDLDVLLLDLPPGTGDIAISLGQLLPNSEVLVVTTPQLAAAEVAERAGRIAHQLKQRIVGVIENMSSFPCPSCGEAISLFGQGGAAAAAAGLSRLVGADIPVLGEIPFDVALREGGDDGKPIVLSAPDSPAAQMITSIAAQLGTRARGLAGLSLGITPAR